MRLWNLTAKWRPKRAKPSRPRWRLLLEKFSGSSPRPAWPNPSGIFFPQARALGINVDESLSPSLLEKVSYLGTLLHSFPAGETAIRKLLEMTLGRKRI